MLQLCVKLRSRKLETKVGIRGVGFSVASMYLLKFSNLNANNSPFPLPCRLVDEYHLYRVECISSFSTPRSKDNVQNAQKPGGRTGAFG